MPYTEFGWNEDGTDFVCSICGGNFGGTPDTTFSINGYPVCDECYGDGGR